MFFLAWCCLDYSLVRSPRFPDNSGDYDWLFVIVPIVTLVANLLARRGQGFCESFSVAVIASVALSVLFIVALVFFGISFHLSIGGSL